MCVVYLIDFFSLSYCSEVAQASLTLAEKLVNIFCTIYFFFICVHNLHTLRLKTYVDHFHFQSTNVNKPNFSTSAERICNTTQPKTFTYLYIKSSLNRVNIKFCIHIYIKRLSITFY